MTPRVSVLLAVHDGEPLVRDAVASVLGQTYADFELLVVDDGSTDRTADIVESFADPRIRLLRNGRNLGQVPSLNRGLREARGLYVARLDHDDACRPDRLDRQVAVLEAEPGVGLVGSWLDLVGEHGRPLGRMRASIADLAEFLHATLIMQVLVSHPAAMYRREPVLELGGYDEATAPAEDKDLWRRLLLARWDARIVQEPLLVYRLHREQLSRRHAEYQREIDGVSQERFLAALAPAAPVRAVRLLLSADSRFWPENPSAQAARAAREGVDAVLVGARERLELGSDQAAKLERLVAARVDEVARRGWRVAPRAWRLAAPALGVRNRALLSLAPALYALLAAARALAAGARRIAPFRAFGRRSRLAQSVYGKIAGGR